MQEFLRRESQAQPTGWRAKPGTLMGSLSNLIETVSKENKEDHSDNDDDFDSDISDMQKPTPHQSFIGNHRDAPLLSVFSAVKGQPVPQFLWKVVEVMLIDWEGDVAWRIGIGKIAYNAWKIALPLPQRVILA
jgi:hypothetical protein